MSSYYEYVANGDKDKEVSKQSWEVAVQDQDTVIGDAMCHAAQIIYDCAWHINECIQKNTQADIDLKELQKAERALCYMEGVDFGLAMDDKSMLWYMTELERCLASIEMSRDNGFQTPIYIPETKPCDLFGYDEVHCRNNPVTFLRIDMKTPTQETIERLKKDLAEDKHFRYLFERGILNPFDFPGAPLPEPKPEEEAPEEVDKEAGDDSQGVLNLRNLFRQNKINKDQYIGGLATLVATGLISKAEFTRLKNAAN